MVERQIEEQSDFHPYNRTQAFLGDVRDWAGSLFSGLAHSRPYPSFGRGWLRDNAVAIWISALWIVALGAYGIGYANRLEAQTGAFFLPTLEMMFFCFAIAGPVAMIWVVNGLLQRTQRLSAAIADQNETVLALATSVASLSANLDAVGEDTAGRLDTACKRMEADTRATAEKLDRALEDISTKIESNLLDSVILLDRSTRDRTAHVEKMLEDDRQRLNQRLDTDAETLSKRIDEILGGIDQKIGHSLTGALDDQRDRLQTATANIGKALETLVTLVDDTAQSHAETLDASVRQNIETLGEAVSTATRMLEKGLVEPVARISERLEETAASIAAHPPASAEELAELLDEAAAGLVRDERALLAENVARIGMLEDATEKLIKQIDRTSRLNPYVDHDAPSDVPAEMQVRAEASSLGLVLTETPHRGPLNWTALVELLEGRPVLPGTRHTVHAVVADPDVSSVIVNGGAVLDALLQEAVHVEDLPPEHISSTLWCRFGKGERGGDIAELAGIEDEITLAIVRARLRRDPELRTSALRFAEAYVSLTERAAEQIGDDPRMIEMADTPFGRAFLIIACLTGLFGSSDPMRPQPV